MATIAGDASILREYLTKHPHEVATYARCAILLILPISLNPRPSLGPVFGHFQHCFCILKTINNTRESLGVRLVLSARLQNLSVQYDVANSMVRIPSRFVCVCVCGTD